MIDEQYQTCFVHVIYLMVSSKEHAYFTCWVAISVTLTSVLCGNLWVCTALPQDNMVYTLKAQCISIEAITPVNITSYYKI